MTKTQFLLFFLTIIPLVSVFIISIMRDYPSITSKITVILPVFFLVNYFHLLNSYLTHDKNSLTLFNMSRDLTIGFFPEPISLTFLGLIALCWVAISYYANRYFLLNNDLKIVPFQIFLTLIIHFISLTILAKNLISVLLFYQSLIFCLYFFGTYFMQKRDIKVSYNLTFLALLSSFFFFLATVLTYKTTGQIDFIQSGVINNSLSVLNYIILLFLYLIGIALVAVVPIYLTYGNLYYLNPPSVIAIFIISYGLLIPLILLKVIIYIFGVEVFYSYIQNGGIKGILIAIITVNLIISATFAIIGDNLKKMLIYLFFNQLIFAVFSLLIMGLAVHKAVLIIISFVLSQILIFFAIGNINIYLLGSEDKTINGIAYKLKITTAFLIFALVNLIGVGPGIGIIAKYFLLKQVIADHSFINCLIIIMNSALNIGCLLKIIYPMFDMGHKQASELSLGVAKKIEFNFGLMLPMILIASLMFFGFLFPGIIVNFVKDIF